MLSRARPGRLTLGIPSTIGARGGPYKPAAVSPYASFQRAASITDAACSKKPTIPGRIRNQRK